MFKKNPLKENGVMGKKREQVLLTTMAFLVILFGVILIVNYLVWLIMVLLWILFNLFYVVYRTLNKRRYEFRKVNNNEWEKLQGKNLIHYTSFLNIDDGKGVINIPCHISPKVNHLLPKRNRQTGYIWFHQADEFDDYEPNLESFLNAHFYEGDPRSHKVVVKLNNLPRERLYIDLKTGYLLIEGDLQIEAETSSIFKWYNEHVYYLSIIKSTLMLFSILFYVVVRQVRVSFEQKKFDKMMGKKFKNNPSITKEI